MRRKKTQAHTVGWNEDSRKRRATVYIYASPLENNSGKDKRGPNWDESPKNNGQ